MLIYNNKLCGSELRWNIASTPRARAPAACPRYNMMSLLIHVAVMSLRIGALMMEYALGTLP